MGIKFANNAVSTLAGALTTGATSLTLFTFDGAKFPVLGAGDYFMMTLTKIVGGAAQREIVKVTARSGDVCTMMRAQEGTTALTFSAGDVADNRITAGTADLFVKQGESLTADEIRGTNFIDKTATNAAATGTVTLDMSAADIFDLTLSGNTTLATSNLPTLSGETFAILVRVSQGVTAYALTWFGSITWLTTGGSAPAAPSASKTIEYVLTTTDGTNWLGRKGASN